MKKVFLLLSLLVSFWNVQALDVVVTEATDGAGPIENSFRWAIDEVNAAGAGPHTITFAIPASSTITMDYNAGGLVDLTNSEVTIDASGAPGLNINFGGFVNFHVTGNENVLKEFTISGNSAPSMTIKGDLNTFENVVFDKKGVNGDALIIEGSNNTLEATSLIDFPGYVIISGDGNQIKNYGVQGTSVNKVSLQISGSDNIISSDVAIGILGGIEILSGDRNEVNGLIGSTLGHKIKITGNENKVQGFLADFTTAALAIAMPIEVIGDKNEFYDLDITNSSNNRAIYLKNSAENIFERIKLTENGDARGFELSGTATSGNVIRDCELVKALANDKSGFYVINGANNNTFENCILDGPWLDGFEIRNHTAGGVGSPNNIIRGNTIFGFENVGIYILEISPGNLIDGNIIYGSVSENQNNYSGNGIIVENSDDVILINNVIGTDASGGDDVAPIIGHGIYVNNSRVTIGRANEGNHIVNCGNGPNNTSFPFGQGIFLENSTGSIKGNVIGTDWDTQSLVGGYGNDLNGIYLEGTSSFEIGGTLEGERNIIGNNGFGHDEISEADNGGPKSGIMFEGNTGISTVVGNLIGTNGSGSEIGNRQEAVTVFNSSNVTITDNVLANSMANGLAVRYESSDVVIQSNLIGTDAAGNNLGNEKIGVSIEGSSKVLIGGDEASQGNVIVNNGGIGLRFGLQSIWVSAWQDPRIVNTTEVSVFNNLFGNHDGNHADWENGEEAILIVEGSKNNLIGKSGAGNVIANKTSEFPAIRVDGDGSNVNTIQGNNTNSNVGVGIQLTENGNKLYGDYSKLTDGATNGAITFNNVDSDDEMISGRAPHIGDVIDIYVSIDGTCQKEIEGKTPQGSIWVASVLAIANPNGDAWPYWEYNITTPEGLSAGLTKDNAIVTATEGAWSATPGNTSEFAQCHEDPDCLAPEEATIASAASAFCGDVTDFTLTAEQISDDYAYQWSEETRGELAGEESSSLVVTESGNYKVRIFDPLKEGECDVESGYTNVIKHDNPVLDGDSEILMEKEVGCIEPGEIPLELKESTNASNDNIKYIWSVNPSSVILSGQDRNKINASFGNASVENNPYTISVKITEEHPLVGEDEPLVCEGGIYEQDIVVEELPILEFDYNPIAEVCESEGNIVKITNYSAANNYSYEVINSANVNNVNYSEGEIVFDATRTNGTIEVEVTSEKGCETTGEVVVKVVGCGNEVVIENPNHDPVNEEHVACHEDEIDFNADLSEGSDEEVLSWKWVIDPAVDPSHYEILSDESLDTETLQLKVKNTTSTDIEVRVFLEVTYEVFGDDDVNRQIITVVDTNLVTVNSYLDLSIYEIEGEEIVCENVDYDYKFKEGFAEYDWAVLSGNASLNDAVNDSVQNVLFGTNNDELVEVGVSVGVEGNGIVCTYDNVDTIEVEIKSTPVVEVDSRDPFVECSVVTEGKVKIDPFNPLSTYEVVSQPEEMDVTIDPTNGDITISAGKKSGQVVIVETTEHQCVSSPNDVTMNVVLTGCYRNVIIGSKVNEGCAGDLVTLEANVVIGNDDDPGEIVAYSWVVNANGEIVGENNSETVVVRLLNGSTSTLELDVELTVEFSNDPIFKSDDMKDFPIRINPIPDLENIVPGLTGRDRVCFDDTASYTIGTGDEGYRYTWYRADAKEDSITVNSNKFTTRFNPVTDFAIPDTVLVSVVDEFGCRSIKPEPFPVTVEELPVVVIDVTTPAIACGGEGEIRIDNYDPFSSYTIEADVNGFEHDEEPDASGIVKFQAASVETSSTLTITETRGTGAKCSSAQGEIVLLHVRGCDITFSAPEKVCPVPSVQNHTIDVIANLDRDISEVESYNWLVTDGVGETLPYSGNPLSIDAENRLDDSVTYEIQLTVIYKGDVVVLVDEIDTTIVTRRPDHNVTLEGTLSGESLMNNCVGDEQEYILHPIDTDPNKNYTLTSTQTANVVTEIGDSLVLNFKNKDYQIVIDEFGDTIEVIGDSTYYVIGSVEETTYDHFCSVETTASGAVRLVPDYDAPKGGNFSCVYEHNRDSLILTRPYDTLKNGEMTRRWIYDGNGITGSLTPTGDSEDTVVVKFGPGEEGNWRDYDVPDVIYVESTYNRDGCLKVLLDSIIVEVDTAYLVHYHIQGLFKEEDLQYKMFCEGDTGQMFVDLQPYEVNDTLAVYDPKGTFGSKDYHYGEYRWEYNGVTTKEVNGNGFLYVIDEETGDTLGKDYYYQTMFNSDPLDTLLYNPYITDTTWSNTYGPFAMEDTVFFIGEPNYCVYDNDVVQSKLKDTLPLNEILQELHEFNLAVEEDEDVHYIQEVVNVPDLNLTDLANTPSFDRQLVYNVAWSNTDGDTLGMIPPALFELNNLVEVPQGVDTVVFFGELKLEVCEVLDTVLLVMDYGLFIPSAFTPNSDGAHDTWSIQNIEKFADATVEVYNRWGSLLYKTGDYQNNEWDGLYEGEPLPIASYYYILNLNDGSDPKSGAVSIFR